jgi:hypothetical protein
MPQKPGDILRRELKYERRNGQRDALSTDPFNDFESMIFVRRNESIVCPSPDSSRSCKARSTGLNYEIAVGYSMQRAPGGCGRARTSSSLTNAHSSLIWSRTAVQARQKAFEADETPAHRQCLLPARAVARAPARECAAASAAGSPSPARARAGPPRR